MSRSSLNVGVDMLALVLFVLLASTGFLITFQLPPGSGGGGVVERPLALTENVRSGMGHGMGRGMGRGLGRMAAREPVKTVWGLSRHEWGDVHFWIAMTMLGTMAVHIYLHWKWVLSKLKPLGHGKYSSRRVALSMIALGVLLAVALAPHFAEVAESPRETQHPSHASAETSPIVPVVAR